MSVIAEEINNLNELSETYIQEGFSKASKAGGLLQDILNMVGKEKFPAWLKENCSISLSKAEGYIKLFNGEKIKISVYIEEKEVQTEPED